MSTHTPQSSSSTPDDDFAQDDLFSTPILEPPAWLTAARAEKALWLVPIIGIAVGACLWAWTFDDGFIYFRTVDQILAGNGPVFNAGERVESFTSPLWLMILTLGDALSPIRLEYTAAALSIACVIGGLLLATLASSRLAATDRPGRIRLPVGLLVMSALWPVWVWSTSGLEVGLTFLWIGASFWALMRWAVDDPTVSMPPRRALVLLGLGWLVRPELIVSSALFVAVVVVTSAKNRRQRLTMIGVAAVIPTIYQVFRMGFYGMVVSSPAVAKEGSVLRAGRGWTYFTNFVGPYVLAVPLLTMVFGIAGPMYRSLAGHVDRRPLLVGTVVATSGATHMIGIILLGGDYVHARLFLPGLFALLAPFFVVACSRRYVEGIVVTAGWAAVCLLWLRPGDQPADFIGTGYPGETLTYEDRGFTQRGSDQPWLDGAGVYLATGFDATADELQFTGRDPNQLVVAAGAVGAFGYVLGPDARVIDLHGLAEPLTAHQRLEFRSVPGHEKMAYGPWLVAMLADDPSRVAPMAIPTVNWWVPDPPPLGYLHDVAWASGALECDAITDLFGSSTTPFGLSTFGRNVWMSVSNTSVRVDRDPQQAYRNLCGLELPIQIREFYGKASFVTQLPDKSEAGDLVVADGCAAVFLGTGEIDKPWQLIAGSTRGATVTIDPDDNTPALAGLFVSDFGEFDAILWIETDGAGNYRLHQEVDWFPPSFQAWTAIPSDGKVEVEMHADLEIGQWLLSGPAVLPGLPVTSATDGTQSIVVPVAAGPSSLGGSIDVDFTEVETDETCQAISDYHVLNVRAE